MNEDLKDFERRYQGQKCSERMSDYVWHLVRDVPVHKRETRIKKAVRFVEKSDSSSEK